MPQPVPSEADLLAQLRGLGGLPQRPPAAPVPGEAELLAQLRNTNPNMSPVEDIARSGATGLLRTGARMAASPHTIAQATPTILDAATDTTDSLASLMRAAIDPKAPAPHLPGWASGVSFDPGKDWASQISRMLGSADNPVGSALASVTSPFVAEGLLGPTQTQADAGAQHLLPYHDPQTMGGRYAQTLGEMAPNALVPGSLLARIARVGIPGLTAQSASELAPPAYKDSAKIMGALLGGGVEGTGEGVFAAPAKVFGRAALNLTPDQIAAAAALRSDATSKFGVDLTIPEAVSQATGGATGLPRIQRLLENSSHSAPGLADYFAQRPGQVAGAVGRFADSIAPGAVGGSPSMLGLDTQNAATGALFDAAGQRSALARPYYAAADGSTVDPQLLASLLDGVATTARSDKTGLIGPELANFHNSFFDADGNMNLDQGSLSTARNYWRDRTDLPPISPGAMPKLQSGIINGALDNLDQLLRANPDRAMGDQVYANASRNIVDPLQSGPVGSISGTGDLASQLQALYPSAPPLGQAQDTAGALGALDAQREGLAAALTRQHVGSTFNQAARDLTAGPNQYGGARFASALIGNPEQAATLNAGLDSIDPGGGLSDQMRTMADVLQATGRRERPGSMTAFNDADLAALKAAPLPVRSLAGLIDPLEWGQHLSGAAGRAMFGRNIDVLSNMIRDPDTVRVLYGAQDAAQPTMPQFVLPPALMAAAQQSPQGSSQ